MRATGTLGTGALLPSPPQAAASDLLRERYERDYSRVGDEGRRFAAWRELGARAKVDHVLALLPSSTSEPTTLLDVGCGDGSLLAELTARRPRWSLAGVEIAESAVARARGRVPSADVRLYDGVRLPWPDGAWDVGVLSHVLEHVHEPVALLCETARACQVVVLEVPLEANLSARRQAKRRGAREIGHLHAFSRRSARRLIEQAGLDELGELSDPLGRSVHRWTSGPRPGYVKWLVRSGVHRLSPVLAARVCTLHWAAACRRAT